MQFNKVNSVEPDAPSAPTQPELPDKSGNFFGKKLYAVIAIILIAVIAVALLIPQGTAIIPLNVDYVVGEKMVYDATATVTFQNDGSASPSGLIGDSPSATMNAQQSIEVIDFDGEYYTLNHTTTMMLNDKPFSYSLIEKMNKTGYSTYLINIGNTEQQLPSTSLASNSYLTQLLNKSEVKVGDTITIPFPNAASSMGVNGDLTMTFRGFEDLTVPAGTYRVFRIDITSNNINMNYIPSTGSTGFTLVASMNLDLNCQIYMEYGTLRQIKSVMQESVSLQSSMMNYTMDLSMDMILTQHVKP